MSILHGSWPYYLRQRYLHHPEGHRARVASAIRCLHPGLRNDPRQAQPSISAPDRDPHWRRLELACELWIDSLHVVADSAPRARTHTSATVTALSGRCSRLGRRRAGLRQPGPACWAFHGPLSSEVCPVHRRARCCAPATTAEQRRAAPPHAAIRARLAGPKPDRRARHRRARRRSS